MKQHLRNIEQRLREILIDPLQKSSGDRVEPLDIWTEVQKQVRAHITLSIAGMPLFPSRHATVVVRTRDESERLRLEGALNPTELRTAIADFLAKEGCRIPPGFWVSVEFIAREGDLPLLAVRFDNEGAEVEPGRGPASLRVLSGEANTNELRISARRINIGRRARLTDEQGQGLRDNDLAFSEVRNGVNETVSRRHAHLDFDEQSSCYRLFRDSRSADTSVVSKSGSTTSVPLGGSGLTLKSGDIIRLGKAEVEFLS